MRSLSRFLVKHFKWQAVLRLIALSIVLQATLLCWGKAYAETWVEREGQRLGSSLFDLVTQGRALDSQPMTHTLSINGLRLVLRTGAIVGDPSDTVRDLLEEAEARCASSGFPLEVGYTSHETSADGYAYCLRPPAFDEQTDMLEALRRFNATGDLSQWGTFEGLYFRKGARAVQLLQIEQKGSLIPEQMFPNHGDVPGRDPEGLPRPAGTRRLSVSHNGHSTLNHYETPGSPGEVFGAYAEKLRASGAQWRLGAPMTDSPSAVTAFVALPDGQSFVLHLAGAPNENTFLSLARLPQ